MPSLTDFAELTEAATQNLQGAQSVVAKAPYKRLSETVHGGLWGLLGDVTLRSNGKFIFEQDNEDLDAVASHVAAWWRTGIWILAEYHGWDIQSFLAPFEEKWRDLYPSETPGSG